MIGSLSILAFPFFTGFYSKDLILTLLFYPKNLTHSFIYFLALTSAYFTAFYSIKILLFTFFNFPNYSLNSLYDSSHFSINIPLFILSLFSIFIGYFTHEYFVGFGTFFEIIISPSHFLLPFTLSFHSLALAP